ncbi:hypothetical protein ES702_04324 [subsurface metagenome]
MKNYFWSWNVMLLLVVFILTSCATGRRRAPISGGKLPCESVTSDETRRERVSKVERKRERVSKPESKRERVRRRKKTVEKAREEPSPVVKKYGEITGDSVNIRAGANINYEILAKLNKADKVSILSSGFGWCEIELPAGCFAWIHSDYVSVPHPPVEGEKVSGLVTGNSVRVRARPLLKCSVLSQVNKGDKVVVVGLEGDWFKIEPPKDCTGWVHSDYVRIVSR